MSNPPLWVVDAENTADHWLELRDPDGWWDAVVKWDGCVDLRRYFNQPRIHGRRRPDDCDYLHICELDEIIERLQSLRALALKHFKGDWRG